VELLIFGPLYEWSCIHTITLNSPAHNLLTYMRMNGIAVTSCTTIRSRLLWVVGGCRAESPWRQSSQDNDHFGALCPLHPSPPPKFHHSANDSSSKPCYNSHYFGTDPLALGDAQKIGQEEVAPDQAGGVSERKGRDDGVDFKRIYTLVKTYTHGYWKKLENARRSFRGGRC